MECPVCGSQKTRLVSKGFTGYVEGTSYDIFGCPVCDSRFIDTSILDKRIYETIYARDDTPGYERYFRYAREVKTKKDPLRHLAREESTYFPVYSFFRGRRGLEVLEVGCGQGYLTFALNKAGHSATGIDISENAIVNATRDFGSHYALSSLEGFKPKKRFDVIVATELIEHLADPAGFIRTAGKLLVPDGRILLTTPNKDSCPKDAVWHTDLPPVHTLWLSKKSFLALSSRVGMECQFSDLKGYRSRRENRLVSYAYSLRKSRPLPILSKDGTPFDGRVKQKESRVRALVRDVLFSPPARDISHAVASWLNKENQTLGVILKKM